MKAATKLLPQTLGSQTVAQGAELVHVEEPYP